jgi:hypothetical protein
MSYMGNSSQFSHRISYVEDILALTKLIVERFGIEIVFNKGITEPGWDGSSYYSPKFLGLPPHITLNVLQPPSAILAILAHEFGHHLDTANEQAYWRVMFCAGCNFRLSKVVFLRRLGILLIAKSISRIVAREEAAWKLGFQFLRENGICATYAMEEVRENGLRYYREQGNDDATSR